MLSQNKIKYLCSLDRKKNRILEKEIVLDGKRLIDEAINHKIKIKHIWITNLLEEKASSDKFINKIKKNEINYSFEKIKDINKVSNTKNTQGIIALVSIENIYNNNLEKFDKKIVILDEISDPGNLGTIIRTCAWFGINSIILTKNSTDIFNPKCIRSSVGGHFFIKDLAYLSYEEVNNFLKKNNIKTFSAQLNGEKLFSKDISSEWALLLGSEAHGLSGKINFDKKITIYKKGKIESLNISVAAGILINELTK